VQVWLLHTSIPAMHLRLGKLLLYQLPNTIWASLLLLFSLRGLLLLSKSTYSMSKLPPIARKLYKRERGKFPYFTHPFAVSSLFFFLPSFFLFLKKKVFLPSKKVFYFLKKFFYILKKLLVFSKKLKD